MSENNPIVIAIRRIKQIAFGVNEKIYRDGQDESIIMEIGKDLDLDVEKELLALTLRVMYRYSDASKEELVIDFVTQNIFQVTNLKDYISENNISFPENVWVSLIGLCVSHS